MSCMLSTTELVLPLSGDNSVEKAIDVLSKEESVDWATVTTEVSLLFATLQ